MSKEAAIIVFQKKPEAGKVKTRLATAVGDEKAAEIYQYLLDLTHRQLALVNIPVFVFFEKEIQTEYLRSSRYYPCLQMKGDLGKKMRAAFETALGSGYQRVIIIGTDCPELKAEDMEAALAALESHDLVIGPAWDGGYYLLGMKTLHKPLFENKKWSTSTVFSDTLADATDLGLKTYKLRPLSDVDIYEDLTDKINAKLEIPNF